MNTPGDSADTIKEENDQMDESTSTVVEDPCPVCLSSRSDESGIDGCAHTFCYSCIAEWLKVSESCPLCKAPATEVRTSRIVDGRPLVKKLSELKAEAEAARIMAQANEVPMTSEREAVTQLIHQQRAAVQKVLSDKARHKNNKRVNEEYRKETSQLTKLQSLRDEMDRLPRREVMGDPRFRQVVYMQQLVWKPISRPSTTMRFNCAVACAHPDELMRRIKPFLMRELRVVLENKKNLTDAVFSMLLTSIQNYEINNPNFEVVMFNTGLFRPWCIGVFCGLLYEFCASGLELEAFDANSTYSLDASRAPSGRLIPNLLPVSSRTNDPIFINADDDEEDDDAVIIDRQRSDTSSSDGVGDLYNHNACRMRPSAVRSSLASLPAPSQPDRRNLHERLSSFLPSFPFPSVSFLGPSHGRNLPSFSRHASKRTIRAPEVISLDDESAAGNQARINSIPRLDLNSSMGDPSWLNVTGEGEPSTSRTAFGSRLNPLSFPAMEFGRTRDSTRREENGRRRSDRNEERGIATSWRAEKDRRNESRRDRRREEKDRMLNGERIGSRKNSLTYFYDKLYREDLSSKELNRISKELSSFSSRINCLREEYKKKIEAKSNANSSFQDPNSGVIEVDDDVIHVQDDQPSSSSGARDDSIVIVS